MLGFGDKNLAFCESELKLFSLARLEKFEAVVSNSIDSPSFATSRTTPCSIIKESYIFPSNIFVIECLFTVFAINEKPMRQQRTTVNNEHVVEVLEPRLR